MKKIILLVLLFPIALFAQEHQSPEHQNPDSQADDTQKLESSVTAFLTGDSYDGRGGGFDLDLGFEKRRLLLGASSSRSDKNQTKDDRVKNYYIGVGSSPLNRHYMNLTLEFWGIRDQFETRSINPSFFLRSPNKRFTINITPGFRRTKIFTDPLYTTKTDYVVSNPYLTLGLSFIGPRKWTLKLEGSRNWYNADLNVLQSYQSSYIFSPSTLDLSNSFQTSRVTLGIGHIFERVQVTLEGTRSQSEIDDIISRTLALKSIFFVQNDLDLGFTVGGTKTSQAIDGESKNNFLELNVAYYWQ